MNVSAVMAGNDAGIVNWDAERGLWVYRASALGGCETAMAAARAGMTAEAYPESFQKKFAEGHRNEALILEKFLEAQPAFENVPLTAYTPGEKDLLSFGPVVGDQVRCEVPVGDKAIIRGHADGIVHHGPHSFFVFEGKAFAKSLWKEWEDSDGDVLTLGDGLWEKYRWQLSTMMLGFGLPAVFVVGEKDEAGVVGQVKYRWIDMPFATLGQLKARVARVENSAARGENLSCARKDYPCPFFYIHEQAADDVARIVDVELEELLASRAEFKRVGEVAGRELKAVNEMIAKGLEQHGRKAPGMKTRVGAWQVTWREDTVKEHVRKASTRAFLDVRQVDA